EGGLDGVAHGAGDVDLGERRLDGVGDGRVERPGAVGVTDLALEAGLDRAGDGRAGLAVDDAADDGRARVARAGDELVVRARDGDRRRADDVDVDLGRVGGRREVEQDVD